MNDGDGSAAGAALAGTGAAATAAAAAACCVPVLSPLLVVVLGASGAAWVAGLKPWAPYLLGGALLLLLYAFWMLRRARRRCDPGEEPPSRWRQVLDLTTRPLLAGATVIWIISTAAYLLLS